MPAARLRCASRSLGSALVSAAVAGLMALSSSAAGGAFRQDFETQVPGQKPRGWSVTWGAIGDDLCRVTNIRAAEGKQCMLLDRRSGTNKEPVKLMRPVPDVKQGWAELSFCMLVDGKAADAQFVVEIGEPHPHQLVKVDVGLRGWGPKVYLYPNTLRSWTENWNAKRSMASYVPGVWHRVTLLMPTRRGGQKQAHGFLEARQADGSWRRAGPVRSVPCRAPRKAYAHLSIVVPRGKRGFELFFDDFRLGSRSTLPEF